MIQDFEFSYKSGDLAIMAFLAQMAGSLQAPIVAGAGPTFFGFEHLAHAVALPDAAGRSSALARAGRQAFWATADARWLILTLNRCLQRVPYGDEQGQLLASRLAQYLAVISVEVTVLKDEAAVFLNTSIRDSSARS